MSGERATTQSPSSAALDSLQAALRGPVERPGSAGYETGRKIWNAMIDRHPAAVARPLGVADVVAAVRWAREHGVELAIKGGGHNIAGLATTDGGLMLDLSLQRGVWVDAERRVARAQGGCLLGDVDAETQLHGLAAVLGFVSATGATGLTLGGGFGYLTRRFGWTCDNVAGMDLVSADGELVRASAEENPELFWALCGGGGNFGVVTGVDYRLHPVGPEIVGGAVAWPGEEAAGVVEMARELYASASPELTCTVVLRLAPPAPWLPAEVHGKPVAMLVVCHSGPRERALAEVAPIKSFGQPVGDVLQPRPYTVQQKLLDATQPPGRRYYWKSEYLPALGPEAAARGIEHARTLPSPHSAVIFFPVGGALDRLPGDANAAGNRDAGWVLNITAAWDDPAADERCIGWARGAWEDMRRFSTGGTYVNFLNEDDGAERTRAAYGGNLARLARVKARWDPDNFFHRNKNVPPDPGTGDGAATG